MIQIRVAMDSDMSIVLSNNTWDLILKPSSFNIMGFLWLYRHNFDSHDRLDRYNGRLLAQGFSQQPSLDV